MSENELILLALALSILGYNIGVLFYALPIPIASVKKWGPVLMRDSLYAAVLVFSSNLILNVIPYFQELLGSSWSVFDIWITERTGWLIGWKMALSTLLAASSKITGGFFLHVIMDPFLKMVNYALTTIYSILSLSVILRGFYARLIILGILLISVPFRLTRKVGAYFIAFSIIFMIGLPFLPVFVTSLTQSDFVEPPSSEGVEFGEIHVHTITGKELCYPVIKGVDNDKMIFLYKGDKKGTIIAGFPDRGIPKNGTYRVYLDYLGTLSPLEPFPVNPERDYILKSSNVIDTRVLLNLTSYLVIDQPVCYSIIMRSYNVVVNSYTFNNHGEGFIQVTGLDEESYVDFRSIMGVEYVLDISPSMNVIIENGTWEWYGLSGSWKRVFLPVNKTISIRYNVVYDENNLMPLPRIKEHSYLTTIGVSPWMDFSKIAADILMSWIVLPAIYLFILGTISSGLAYVIGGSRDKVPIRLW